MSKQLTNRRLMTNEEWLELYSAAADIISAHEIDEMEERAVNEIRRTVAGKTAAYAWSGGSDSAVLSCLCQKAGITDCMIGICELEYPAFLDWMSRNAPERLTVINTKQDLEWLAAHQDMLFPQDSAIASRWYAIVQHAAQREYVKANDVDILVLGRRKADSNYCGRGSNIYTDHRGVTRYSPMAEWKHEHVLAYIQHRGLRLPPLYTWENGFRNGTHPWAARQHVADTADGWRVIYGIDPGIVLAASSHIESARAYLEGLA